MTTHQLSDLIQKGETLAVEFKGEERAPLSDRDLIEAIVCLANRPGSISTPFFFCSMDTLVIRQPTSHT